MSDQAQIGLAFLDQLERQEAELLSWGMVDGFFDIQELENLATDFLDELAAGSGSQAFSSSDELIEWLEAQNLLWCIPNSGGDKWRTRMAEGVRLISRLRQLLNPTGWQQAANLVADFRFHLQPREFPKRSIHPDQVIRKLSAQSSLTQLQKKVISAYLQAETEAPMQLSEFQVRASERILSAAAKRRFGATIVCAGTGSGKTLAFFLPTLVHLARKPNRGKAVPCLALYPRKELLKDQFRAAIGELLKLNPVFDSERHRSLSIGTFYGDTPEDANALLRWGKWGRSNGPRGPGFICPFARCSECGNDMVWDEKDVRENREILRCSQCELELGPKLIRLTRSALLTSPPDVLFTTTEMLNQRMSSDKFRGLFGIGVSDSPQIVLLDEVHTYDGVHGAQVGNLIRRWRHLSGAHPHFVGLSATLADAVRFMADLTGIYQVNVEEVKPLPEDMTREGMEYLLALRGDAVSGKSLLSTSIQTAFLLSRLMEPMHSHGREVKAYGKKVFAFTDDLDVTNRLYHSLMDAEGWARYGSPSDRRFGALANLRASHRDDHEFRLDDGQSWDLVEKIGHSLQDGERSGVGRVSSQDSGVDQSASVIVATASLEVGYDDPEVGAVIQHKAPRNAASYLQRKGRAGRGREMRPWTTIVLSDYGRDRAAYLGYDRLFSPVVPPRYLPLHNRFVLRIQATYALIDWLANQPPTDFHRDSRRSLSQPATGQWADLEKRRHKDFSEKVQKLLTDPSERSRFTHFISRSLEIEPEVANALLWDPPRALMTAVLPTLQRRLDEQWKNADGTSEHYTPFAPLPEFIPKTLFDDLNLPQVNIMLGETQSKSGESMPIIQSLKEFAPGRVSKRFQVSDSWDAYWIAPPNENPECELPVNSFLRPEDTQELGVFRYWGEQGWIDIPALRPYALKTERPRRNIGGTSNAFPIWRTQLVPGDAPHQIDLPLQSSWNSVFSGIEFHLHSLGNPLEMRRFTLGSEASVRKSQGRANPKTIDQEIRFVREDEEGHTKPVALGFTADVDAILFKITLPKTLKDHCIRDPQLLRGLRTSFFKDRLQKTSDLPRGVNKFQRDWLADIYLAAITHEAVTKEIELSEAATAVQEERASLPLDEVLSVVFQTVTDAGDEEEEARITGQLRRLITDPAILSVIQAAAKKLWEQPDAMWEVWLRSRLRETLGAALHSTCTRFCDQLDVGDLIVDLDPGPSPSGEPSPSDLEDDIWLTESTIGGSGFAEFVLQKLGEDPNRFLQFLEAELEPSDAEEVDYNLSLILNYLDPTSSDGDEDIQLSVASLRNPGTQANASKEYKHLRSLLSNKEVTVNRPLGTSLNLRILRPGSTPSTDQVLRKLLSRWENAEERLGIEIDLRVFAYTCTTDQSFDRAFTHLGRLPQQSDARLAWRFNALISMLWPRGAVLRRESLSYYNRFADPPQSQCDRLLLRAIQPNPLSAVSVMDQNWREKLREILLQDGQAELFAKRDEKSELRAAIINLMVEEMDTGFLLTCPRVVGTRKDRDLIRVTLDLPEAVR
jgi:hypothetical protein